MPWFYLVVYVLVILSFLGFLLSGPWYHDRGVTAPYGCHPSEPACFPGHGWRFPPPALNYRDSLPFRPHYEDAIPVANRGIYPPSDRFSSISKTSLLSDVHMLLEFLNITCNFELRFMIIMFQAQVFGSPGEEKLPINGGRHASVYSEACLLSFTN